MVKQVRDLTDQIMIQFYNTKPSAYSEPAEVILAHDDILRDVFQAESSSVVVRACS